MNTRLVPPALLLADWAHPSWLLRAAPARSERARAEASACLLARFPLVAQAAATQLPWFAATLPRAACARLLRTSAALAHASSLRQIVSHPDRLMFARKTGLPLLTALQSHPRGARDDLPLDASIDVFDRDGLAALGLAIALRATEGAAQRQWLQLRLPRACAERAAHWRLPEIAPHCALELIADARRLMRPARPSC